MPMVEYGAIRAIEPKEKTLNIDNCVEFFTSLCESHAKQVEDYMNKVEVEIEKFGDDGASIIEEHIAVLKNQSYYPRYLNMFTATRGGTWALRNAIGQVLKNECDKDRRSYFMTEDGRYDTRVKSLRILYDVARAYPYIIALLNRCEGERPTTRQINLKPLSKFVTTDLMNMQYILLHKQLPPARGREKVLWMGTPSTATDFALIFGFTMTEWNKIFFLKRDTPLTIGDLRKNKEGKRESKEHFIFEWVKRDFEKIYG